MLHATAVWISPSSRPSSNSWRPPAAAQPPDTPAICESSYRLRLLGRARLAPWEVQRMSQAMTVRAPHFDFSGVPLNWAPENPEAAHYVDASGIVPAYIEPFLIKVMNRAKALLDPV